MQVAESVLRAWRCVLGSFMSTSRPRVKEIEGVSWSPTPPKTPRPRKRTASSGRLVTLERSLVSKSYDSEVELTELLSFGKHKLRLVITSNSYDHQSRAYLDALNTATLEWNRVVYRPALAMKTPPGMYYNHWTSEKNAAAMAEDRQWLLDVFMKLVG